MTPIKINLLGVTPITRAHYTAEALVTTALGLAIALPEIWMFNYFNSQLRSFAVEINQPSNELINFFQAKDADCHSAE